jgi:hypothetical protein
VNRTWADCDGSALSLATHSNVNAGTAPALQRVSAAQACAAQACAARQHSIATDHFFHATLSSPIEAGPHHTMAGRLRRAGIPVRGRAQAWTASRTLTTPRYTRKVASRLMAPAAAIHQPGAALSPVTSISHVEIRGVRPPNSAVARL